MMRSEILVTADNADAKVKRTYYANGLIQTDSLRIPDRGARQLGDAQVRAVVQVRSGRRRDTLLIPDQLRPDTVPRIVYFYNFDFGFLQSIWDIQKNAYQLSYCRAEISAPSSTRAPTSACS